MITQPRFLLSYENNKYNLYKKNTCCCKGNNYDQRFARTKSQKHDQGKAGQGLPEWHIVRECKMGRR